MNNNIFEESSNNKTNDIFNNVYLEVYNLIWEYSGMYIYMCKILNPRGSLDMLEDNYIALHSENQLLNKTKLHLSIRLINKSKYPATYNHLDSYSNSSYRTFEETQRLKEEEEWIEAEAIRDSEMDDMREAEMMGMDLDEYYAFQELEGSRDPFDL